MTLTHKRLLELVNYDPETGLITSTKGCCRVMGKIKSNGYRQIGIDYRSYYASRIAFFYMTGKWPSNEMDHINKIRDDNRWCNLREATRTQNLVHRETKPSASGLLGVRKSKNGKWEARVSLNKKGYHLGTFLTKEEAAMARDVEVVKLFGRFARLNFPQGWSA